MRSRSLSQALRSLVRRRDSQSSEIEQSSEPRGSDTDDTSSVDGDADHPEPLVEEEDADVAPPEHIDYNDASSIIGGRSSRREEDYEEKAEKKIFSFGLPFSNPLANFDFPRFSRLFHNYESDQGYEPDALETITSRQEDEMFTKIQSQDKPRMRAVKHALTPNFDSFNPLVKDPFPQIDGDVVVLGGYRGSILRDNKTRRRVWIPIKVGLNLRKIDLTVGLSDEAEYEMEKLITPDGMLTHIGPVDVSRKLLKKLAAQPKCRVHEFAYDWRLSSDINSAKLAQFIKQRCRDKAIVIAHSMGGLITHHAMTKEPELFRGVIYAGSPSACPNILGPLRHGDSVLLSSRILTAQVNFLMRSSFSFLPLDGRCFVDKHDSSKRYDLDFFDVNTWIEYGLSPCVASSRGARRTHHQRAQTMPADVIGQQQQLQQQQRQRHKRTDSDEPVIPKFNTFNWPSQDLISYEEAVEYLSRTLARTKKFLQELEYDETQKEQYPPMAVLYGYTVPTLKGARVDGVEGIKRGDYTDLQFGAGDGVVYHKSLMPIGKGFPVRAKIPSDRGHVSLLNDIEGVGRALAAILADDV